MASVCPLAPLSKGVVILCWVGINKIKAAWSVRSPFSLTLPWVLGTVLSIPGRPTSLKRSPQCFHSRRAREACCDFGFGFTPCLQSKVNAMKTGNSVPDTNACFRIDSDSREQRGAILLFHCRQTPHLKQAPWTILEASHFPMIPSHARIFSLHLIRPQDKMLL